jgi:hypothetical protein
VFGAERNVAWRERRFRRVVRLDEEVAFLRPHRRRLVLAKPQAQSQCALQQRSAVHCGKGYTERRGADTLTIDN